MARTVPISVIMPIYNDEECLSEALESFESQTLPGAELIAVDDRSTDGSRDVLQRYRSRIPELKILEHSENRGPSAARNTAIAEAQGEFLAFLDADDRYERDNALETLYDRASSESADVALFGFRRFWNDGKTRLPEGHLQSLKSWARSGSVVSLESQPDLATFSTTVWSKVVRRSFWEGLGLHFPELSRERKDDQGAPAKLYYEDVYTTLMLMFSANRVVCCDRILYGYRKGKPSITESRGEETLDVIECLDRALDRFVENGRLSVVAGEFESAMSRKGEQYEGLIRPEFRARFVSRFDELVRKFERLKQDVASCQPL